MSFTTAGFHMNWPVHLHLFNILWIWHTFCLPSYGLIQTLVWLACVLGTIDKWYWRAYIVLTVYNRKLRSVWTVVFSIQSDKLTGDSNTPCCGMLYCTLYDSIDYKAIHLWLYRYSWTWTLWGSSPYFPPFPHIVIHICHKSYPYKDK